MNNPTINTLPAIPVARAEAVALAAVREISTAIENINKKATGTMVRWPLDIEVLCDGGSRVFDFAELHERLSKDASKEQRA